MVTFKTGSSPDAWAKLVRIVFLAALLSLVAQGVGPGVAGAQLRYDREYPSIRYTDRASGDRLARLWQRVQNGELSLAHEGQRGYLASLLEGLEISTASQLLVFTRTSFQGRLISPENPRAIYFNDDTYVAWVPGSDVIEISAIDSVMGGMFYTLAQDGGGADGLVREGDLCLQCHDSYSLSGGGVPRHFVGSMVPDENGQSVYHEGWQLTDDRTPMRLRWGGWYVTGTHGDMVHRGNARVEAPATAESLDFTTTGNRRRLDDLFDTSPYLSGHSDIVALMVLEHQVRAQNALTRVGYDVRTSLHRDEVEGRSPAPGQRRASARTLSVIERVGEPLVEALLFVDEARLEAPLSGTSGFAEEFERRGIRDARGRSLRTFDLQTRLFRYPVSYMIDTIGFDGLPIEARRYVARRLREVLEGREPDARFAHVVDPERTSALEILRETKPDLFPVR